MWKWAIQSVFPKMATMVNLIVSAKPFAPSSKHCMEINKSLINDARCVFTNPTRCRKNIYPVLTELIKLSAEKLSIQAHYSHTHTHYYFLRRVFFFKPLPNILILQLQSSIFSLFNIEWVYENKANQFWRSANLLVVGM